MFSSKIIINSILPVLLFVLLTGNAQGQMTQYHIGGPGNEMATRILYLPSDGSAIIGGYSYNLAAGGVVTNCQAILMKVKNNGTIAWQKTFGIPTKNNIIKDMIITRDSNIIVVGTVGGNGVMFADNTAAIIKFNSTDGSLIWQQCFRDVATTTGGEAFFGVTELTDGTGRLVAVGVHDWTGAGAGGMICVFQSTGALIYDEVLDIASGDDFEGVTTSAAGNSVYMCGEFVGNYKDGRVMSYTPGATSGVVNWVQYFDYYVNGTYQDNFLGRIYLSGAKLVLMGWNLENYSFAFGQGESIMTLNAADGSGAQIYGVINSGLAYANQPGIAVVSADHIFNIQSPSTAYYDATAWITGVSTNTVITEITSLAAHTTNPPIKFTSSVAGQHSILDMRLQGSNLYMAGATNITSGFGNNDIYYVNTNTGLSSLNHTCDTVHDNVTITSAPFTSAPPVVNVFTFTPTYTTVDTASTYYNIGVICGDFVIADTVCNILTMPDSLHACANAIVTMPATLTGSNSVTSILWTPATGLSNDTILNPTLTVTSSGWYDLTVKSIIPNNLVVNGDFSAGNTGFTSSYTYVSGPGSLVPAGVYAITTNPNLCHPTAGSFGDHTTGTGNMLAINGASTPINVWCETISVLPNTYYDFSAWFANWSSDTSTNLPMIQFEINGILIGSLFSFPHPDGLWTQFATTWYSGTNTSATICINDQQTAAFGNDFAIDDISFEQLCILKDSVYIDAAIPDTIHHSNDTGLCVSIGNITLNAPAGYSSYLWNTGSTSASIVVNSSGIYWVTANTICGLQTDTIKVVYNPLPVVSLGNDTVICPGDVFTLTSAQPAGTQYSWSTGSNSPSIQVSNAGTYTLTVTLNGCSATTSIIVSEANDITPVKLGPDTSLCLGDVIYLNVNNNDARWSTNQKGSGIKIDYPGTYWVTVSESCGTVSDTINIDFHICDIGFPSAFTPNGDGKNDIIGVVGTLRYYKDFSLSIYNRFGERVYYSEDIFAGWDGIYKGVKQDLGTYFYMIFYSLEGKKHMLKGDFELIR